MKGLILKDLLFIKNNSKSLIVFIILIGVFALNSKGDTTTILFFLPFFFMMMCISTFSYDEYNKWNGYAITLPGGRKTIVRSKYIMTIIMVILGMIAAVATLYILKGINNKVNIGDGFSTLLGSITGIIITICIMYPLIYKFGSEKGRIALFVIIVLISMISGLILSAVDLTKIVSLIDKYGVYIVPILCIIFLYISYRISLIIYKKKEF